MNEMLFYDLKQSTGMPHSLATQIAQELGRRIVAQSYMAGDLIEDETALSAKYSVSRSVIRDAVKILVGKGLLEVRRGIGTRVRARRSWGLLDDDVLAWHQSSTVSPEFLEQLFEVRVIIEPKAAAWAATRGTDEDLAAIMAAQEQMETVQGSIDDFVLADAVFHRCVLRASKNEILCSMEGVIFSALLNSIRVTNADPEYNIDSLPFHCDVANAIVARDAVAAEKAMTILLSDTQDRLNVMR
jgi:GntR family galactonate operon transcriptional repressor